jgi:hypothetical protein
VLRILPHERLNAELSKQVQDVVAGEPALDAFRIPRVAHAAGHRPRHRGRRDAPIRLYRKEGVRFEVRNSQLEVMAVSKRVGSLPSYLSYESGSEIDGLPTEFIPFPDWAISQEKRRRMAA